MKNFKEEVEQIREARAILSALFKGLDEKYNPLSKEPTLQGIIETEELITKTYPPGREPMPTTVLAFGVYLGDALINIFPGSHWQYEAEEIWHITIELSMGDGIFVSISPFERVAHFWIDKTRKMSSFIKALKYIVDRGIKNIINQQGDIVLDDGIVIRTRSVDMNDISVNKPKNFFGYDYDNSVN